ncbi:hypothetical protein BDR03DRAFT_1056640 [Suillus americanus]|nr:hypothetical protein BDR03DRAFT_1056640 [Suillus americanus]
MNDEVPADDIPWPQQIIFDNARDPAVTCPNSDCQQRFSSIHDLLAHLNHPTETCWPSRSQGHMAKPPALRGAHKHHDGQSGADKTMEDSNRTAQYHPQSGYVYGDRQNIFQQIQNDKHEPKRTHNLYWPFRDHGEWSLGKFLVETMTQTEIDCFLKLSWFNVKEKPSFSIQGYTTAAPIHLIWCDDLEVAKSLFGNPIFAQNMSFDPLHDQLPEGATIMPIIAASDKTPVTRQTGGLEMHPLFLTISNINSDIRMKATSHAWRCVAYIPIPKFETHSDYHTILKSRVWHKCVDLVFASLKVAAKVGEFMPDPFGELRYCFTPLVAWIADLPEQLMIASVSKNASPITLATHKQFRDANHHDPHTAEHTLELLYILSKSVNPWNLDRFQKKAKELLLLGIHLPFWCNWALTQVFIFLVPEILHTLHKFFFDHLLQWCKEVVRSDELDAHYKSHHKCIGVHHFSSGISHVAQMTGREHCDIQCTIIAMISAIHALINFMYQAQNPHHLCNEFHNCKVAILEAEARQGKSSVKEDFYIPKLELLLSFAKAIRNNGGLIQFTADVSEQLLIAHCKSPFTRTSKQKDFGEQIVHILDREERMRQSDLYLLLRQHNHALVNADVDEDEEVYAGSQIHRSNATDPTMAWVSRVAPDKQHHFSAPRPTRNHFTKGILSDSANAALTVTRSPDGSNLSWPDVMRTYGLPDLCHKVTEYIRRYADDVEGCFQMFSTIKIWSKFRIQLHSTFCPSIIMPNQAVQAKPPSDTFPSRNCDAIFLDTDQGANNPGFPVAQVRIVFQLAPPRRSTAKLPDFLLHPLLYVQPFRIVKTPEDLEDTQLWKLERVYAPATQPKTRTGFVIPITEVTHAAELVPVYREKVDRSLTSATSQEHYDHFYLNRYADKEMYNALHESLHTEYTL